MSTIRAPWAPLTTRLAPSDLTSHRLELVPLPTELARRPFSLGEARSAGLTWRQLQSKRFQRVGYGMYALAAIPKDLKLMLAAAQRRVPAQAVFSGRTAARLHGLDVPLGDRIEMTIPNGCGISAREGLAIRRARVDESEIVVRQGMRKTSILRTLLDLGMTLPLVEAMVAVDMALHLRKLKLDDLEAAVQARSGTRKVTGLRRIVDLTEPATESPMETRLRILLVLAGLPGPQVQASLEDEQDVFVGRADLYYPSHRLVIEYDGGNHRDRLVGDDRRQNALVSAGYRVLRFTAADVLGNPEAVIAQVRAALWRRQRPRCDTSSHHYS